MAGTTTVRRFDMGRVFRNGFAVFNRFPVTLLAIGALLTFPTVIATDWANLHLIGPRPPADDIPASLRRIGMLFAEIFVPIDPLPYKIAIEQILLQKNVAHREQDRRFASGP